MATEALKATALTNLDAIPFVQNTVGEGASGFLRVVAGSVTVTTGYLATSTYALCRVPSNAKVRHVFVGVDATVTTFAGDLGWFYSTSTTDGTAPANRGNEIATDKGDFFGEAIDFKTAGFVDYTVAAARSGADAAAIGAMRLQPLWTALGLATDPGGFFDLVITNTSTNSGAAVVNAEVQYVE